MFRYFLKMKFSLRSFPPMLLVVCLLAFGILIPKLGFYWDDFETILLIKQYPLSEFWRYFGANRPFAGWTYVLFSPLLGTRPVVWHFFSLLLRWLAALGMWWAFSGLWPKHRYQMVCAAFLFAIYPIFVQQPIAVAYHQHWMAFTLYFLSLGLMIQAYRKPRQFWLFTLVSVFAQILNLLIFEYFYGVELLRPIIFWFLVGEQNIKWRQKIILTIKKWLPYMFVLLFFILWRFYFSVTSQADTDHPVLLFELFKQPAIAIIKLAQMAMQDMLFVLVTGWYRTLQPALVNLSLSFSLLVWFIVAGTAFGVARFLSRLSVDEKEEQAEIKPVLRQVLFLGILATFLGTLPVWMTGRQSSLLAQNSDRFSMVSMFGASLVLVAVLEWLVARKLQRAIILGALIGLSVGLHLRVANEYRWSWVAQQRIYWQLYWRAPAIEPNTNLLAEDYLFSFVDPTFSFNLLYLQPQGGTTSLSYYFNLLDRNFSGNENEWLSGREIRGERRQFTYIGSSLDSLILVYNPPVTACLWVLTPADIDTPYLSSVVYKALPLVNLSRIQPVPSSSGYPPDEIFGRQPDHGWCYFYQRAELARQLEDWQQVVALGDEARQRGFSLDTNGSESPHEWLPFIEGYANSGRWEEAEGLTMSAYEKDKQYTQTLCHLWQRVGKQEEPHTGKMIAALGCP